MVFVSYPNNPTGAVIEDDFFARLVAFAREHDIVVVHDNAYADITFDGYVAPSFLQTPGASEVGVELFSLSKSYNMTGWRAGAVVGNPAVVDAYWRLKTNMDSGMFGALQHAAAAALTGPQDSVAELRRLYTRRRDLLVAALRRVGMSVDLAEGHDLPVGPGAGGHTSGSFAELVAEPGRRHRLAGRRLRAVGRRLRAALAHGARRPPARGRRAHRGARQPVTWARRRPARSRSRPPALGRDAADRHPRSCHRGDLRRHAARRRRPRGERASGRDRRARRVGRHGRRRRRRPAQDAIPTRAPTWGPASSTSCATRCGRPAPRAPSARTT